MTSQMVQSERVATGRLWWVGPLAIMVSITANRKVPHAAAFVIERAGRVIWKFLNTNARSRAENRDILQAFQGA
jgi:hypothetical protein